MSVYWPPSAVGVDPVDYSAAFPYPKLNAAGDKFEPAAGGGMGQLSSRQIVADGAPKTLYVNGPNAVYDPVSHRTFYAWQGVDRDLMVCYFDHAIGAAAEPVKVGNNPLAADNDHGGPTITLDLDGHIHIVWGGHQTEHTHSTSDSPRDIASWSAKDLHVGTYPQINMLDNGDLLIVDRAGVGEGASFPSNQFAGVRRSTDGGDTWGTYLPIIDATGSPGTGSRVYPLGVSYVGGLIHVSWFVTFGVERDRQNVYHATYDPDNGTMRNAAGTDLGTVVEWDDHPACLAFEGAPVPTMRHLVIGPDRIHVVFPFGGESWESTDEDFTAHVTTWNGSGWSTVDTGAPLWWRFADTILVRHRDGIAGLFCTRESGDRNDVTVWLSPDGGTWTRAGVLLEGATGEGFNRLSTVKGTSPWVALAQEMPAGFSRDPGDGTPPILTVTGTFDWTPHGDEHHIHDYLPDGHETDPDAHPDLRDLATQASLIAVDAGTVTYDDSGDTLGVTVETVWGVDEDGPYYDGTGAAAGDEAALYWDPGAGGYLLVPYHFEESP